MPDDEARTVFDIWTRLRSGLDTFLAYADEAQLLDYGESAGTGEHVKLRLNPGSLDAFRGRERVSASKQGRVYLCALIELDDDGTPVNQGRVVKLASAIAPAPTKDRNPTEDDLAQFLGLSRKLPAAQRRMLIQQAVKTEYGGRMDKLVEAWRASR
jgi:hypothetical protein